MGSNKQPLGLEHMDGKERKNIHHYLVMGKIKLGIDIILKYPKYRKQDWRLT